jgi:hypothetical protein
MSVARSRSTSSQSRSHWTRELIEEARQASLPAILAQRGYAVRRLPNGAVWLPGFAGLLIHSNRWIWKNQHLHGNTIDFFVVIEGKSFDDAMQLVHSWRSCLNEDDEEDDEQDNEELPLI